MELLQTLLGYFLHLDQHLKEFVSLYGIWTYLALFIVIFCETGFVITPFMPGDSLLFAAGTLITLDTLNPFLIIPLLMGATILGDTVNYWIGFKVGPSIFHRDNVRLLNKKHLLRAQQFYEKHGGKVIILARFIPIIRTFAPFVAGIGKMSYRRFICFNVIGGIGWVALFICAGWLFGNLTVVKDNFSLVIIAIIIISALPAVIEYFKNKGGHEL